MQSQASFEEGGRGRFYTERGTSHVVMEAKMEGWGHEPGIDSSH